MNPQVIVMAAVRAIEHVNARTTRGVPHWADFASEYFKKAQSRIRIVEFIGRYTRAAVDNSPGLPRDDPRNKELHEINSKLQVREWPHQMFNARAAADHVPALKRIYADHWLVRGLGELETILATPAGMCSRLEEQGRRFDRHLGRLKRTAQLGNSRRTRFRQCLRVGLDVRLQPGPSVPQRGYESDSHRPGYSLTHDRLPDRPYRPIREGPNHRRYRCAVRRMDIASADPDLAAGRLKSTPITIELVD